MFFEKDLFSKMLHFLLTRLIVMDIGHLIVHAPLTWDAMMMVAHVDW